VGANILAAINPTLTRVQTAMEAELGRTTIAEIAGRVTAAAQA
jgi:hypothetical protein